MRQDIIDLYDAFTHGTMGRRAFMKRLATIAGGTAAATALLPLLENNNALAATVAEGDPRLYIGEAQFGDIAAYRAALKPETARSAVIVIHENRGLNPHIKDVARRVALEGFDAYAVDMLSPVGGTPEDPDKAREMIYQLDPAATVARLAGVAAALEGTAPGGKVGAVGFCWGGGMVNELAAAAPGLDAGVAYYGRQVDAEKAAKIKAALMLHYAGEDTRTNAGVPDYETALNAAGVDYKVYVYEGAQHAFNNDASAARYNKQAVDLAWSRSIAFLKEKLSD